MASTKEYLDFVLDALSPLGDVSARAMMGEYVLYLDGKVIGGVYDDRLLLKATDTALALMRDSAFGVQTDAPYPGAREMLVAEVDDRELVCRIAGAVAADLPEPKPKKSKGERK